MSDAPNNTKLINFLLSMLLALLFMQMIFPSAPKKAPVVTGPVTFSALHAEYAVPAIPEINIKNNASGTLSIDTCKDIKVMFDGAQISNVPAAFCKTILVASGQKDKLDLKPLSSLFTRTGDIAFQLSHSGVTLLA